MPRRWRDSLKSDFKNHCGRDAANRPEFLDRCPADYRIDLSDFAIRQAGVCFCKWDQLALALWIAAPAVPERESVIGVERGAAAMPPLRIHQYRIHGIGIDFPLPPDAALLGTAYPISRADRLEHHAFNSARARTVPHHAQPMPIGGFDQGRQDQARRIDTAHDIFQPAATLRLDKVPDILAAMFQ